MTITPVAAAIAMVAACVPGAWVGAEPEPDAGADAAPATEPEITGPPVPSPALIALARIARADGPHAALVLADDGDAITAIDLGAAPGPLLARVVAVGIDGVLDDADGRPVETIDHADLLPPVDGLATHVNLAENYVAHQDETGAGGLGGPIDPFLFPKIAAPTPAIASVPALPGELLDYEVELCVVLGEDVATAAAFDAAILGFFVCGDMSDRAIQIRDGDPFAPEAAAGFTDAKSKPGYLPTGPYLAVPRDWRAFVGGVTLHLAVDGEARQDAPASEMIWAPDRAAAEVLAIGNAPRWTYQGAPVGLIPDAILPAGLVMMTGTPGGVVFRPPSLEFILEAIGAYFAAGGPLTGVELDAFIKQRYLDAELASGKYLAPGDELELSGTGLGRQRITIQ
jgi:2-keto-4-pentenoate hydratase/2-oxohepta-3-ene-1,7-dioic acid hydratase in catechol pathway